MNNNAQQPGKPTPRRAKAVVLLTLIVCVALASTYVVVGMYTARDDGAVAAEGEGGAREWEPPLEDGASIQLKDRQMGRDAGSDEEAAAEAEETAAEAEAAAAARVDDANADADAATSADDTATEPEPEAEAEAKAADKKTIARKKKTLAEDKPATTEAEAETAAETAAETPAETPPAETPSAAQVSADEVARLAPFADDAGKKLVDWGRGGPAKGGVANETGAAGYPPYLHRPQPALPKRGQWVALERMLGDTAVPGKKGRPSLFSSLQPSYKNHEAYHRERGCFGTCAERGVVGLYIC
jgi:hypothetical protein